MSSFLTARELTDMRDALDSLLPDTCNVLFATQTSNGAGGFTEVWGTAASNVSCRLDAIQGGEGMVSESLQPQSSWMLTLPFDVQILPPYRVEIGGNTYAVLADNGAQSDLICKRVQVQRVY